MPSPARGCYLLLLRLSRTTAIRFAGRQEKLTGGYYVYCGSAQTGLQRRLGHYFTPSHSRHWHIDRLLKEARIIDVQIRFSQSKLEECRLAREVAEWPWGRPVAGFGSSDCNCHSHLFYFRKRPLISIRNRQIRSRLPMIYDYLRLHYSTQPMWQCDPFQTLAGCILSLRTRDPVTEQAMKRLFSVYPSPRAMLEAEPEELARLIYPVGMYNQKARNLKLIAEQLVNRHRGAIPSHIDDLLQLPGVGRKTANLVRSFAFKLPAICVDTHVHRITNRWGLVRTTTPDQSETELERILPEEYWLETNYRLVQHGQQLCRPVRPRCQDCGIREFCLYQELQEEAAILSIY